jgi:hypothetical protein
MNLSSDNTCNFNGPGDLNERGQPRPDKEDTGGCDMGAYERQSD